jgi:hypothetical protein
MTENPVIHVWITKYALTEGILECDAEHCLSVSASMVKAPSLGIHACFHGEGKDWHRTREGAVARAEQMRLAKIANLKKAIKRLESMRFE